MDTVDASGVASAVIVDLNVKYLKSPGTEGAVADNPATAVDETEDVPAEEAAVYTSIEKVIGSENDDTLLGNMNASTTLMGGAGGDTLTGGSQDDMLVGGGGNDRLDGSDGDDMLDGGPGNDFLTGGAGVDTFVYNGGNDRIVDFEISNRGGINEKIDVTALDLTEEQLREVLNRSESAGGSSENLALDFSVLGNGYSGKLLVFDYGDGGDNSNIDLAVSDFII